MFNQMESNCVSEDVNMKVPRGRTNCPSINSSKKPSNHSNVSFISYNIRMEAQNNNPIWVEQMDSP